MIWVQAKALECKFCPSHMLRASKDSEMMRVMSDQLEMTWVV